jgi:hypothetical protein
MPLLVGREASLAALDAAAATPDKLLLLVAQRDGDEAEPTAAGLHRVGVVARVLQLEGDALYYLAEFPIAGEDVYRFELAVTPAGAAHAETIRFEQPLVAGR